MNKYFFFVLWTLEDKNTLIDNLLVSFWFSMTLIKKFCSQTWTEITTDFSKPKYKYGDLSTCVWSTGWVFLLLKFVYVQGVCYVTNPAYIAEARRQWERRTNNAITDYVVVSGLPRGALLEWQVSSLI